MNRDAIRQIRLRELELTLPLMTPGARVLEIGAGAGWQARELYRLGFEVEAVDIAASRYRDDRVWPVVDYDGRNLPFDDGSFDLLFSSNVLEHVPHIEDFQSELQRVLRPGGRAIHILPSATWRLWTTVTHIPYTLVRLREKLGKIHRRSGGQHPELSRRQAASLGVRALLGLPKDLLPICHGARGNAWSEFYFFSRFFWARLFRRSGWTVAEVRPNRLCYSGYQLLGESIGHRARCRLSRVFGSSCRIYVLETPPSSRTDTPIQEESMP